MKDRKHFLKNSSLEKLENNYLKELQRIEDQKEKLQVITSKKEAIRKILPQLKKQIALNEEDVETGMELINGGFELYTTPALRMNYKRNKMILNFISRKNSEINLIYNLLPVS
jgi:hypothetical protein